jgi:hypothetical protein
MSVAAIQIDDRVTCRIPRQILDRLQHAAECSGVGCWKYLAGLLDRAEEARGEFAPTAEFDARVVKAGLMLAGDFNLADISRVTGFGIATCAMIDRGLRTYRYTNAAEAMRAELDRQAAGASRAREAAHG